MRRPPLPLARLLVVLGLVAGPVLLASPASAQEPSRLADQLTDDAGVLSDADRAEVETALQELQDADGTQLFVVFVDTFDGRSGPDWATETAELSGLGTSDALFAVAVEDRAYGIDVADGFRLSAAEMDDLAVSDVEPRLGDDEWGAAAVALAEGLTPGSPPWAALGIGAGVLAVGGGGFLVVKRRRDAAEEAERVREAGPYPDESTEQLTARASEGLLAVDEAVRTSQLDLDFARLQYGEAAVGEFAGTVGTARQEMAEAFSIRQQLDDETPEDEPTQRRMLARLLELVQAADDRLDAQAAAFAALRDLEANAPRVLDGLTPRVTALTGRFAAEEQRVEALRRRWAPAVAASVEQAVPEARQHVAAADAALAAARSEVQAGRPGAAVSPLRAAEAAVASAQFALDSVGAREQEVHAAATGVAEARADLQAGIVSAGQADPADAAALAEPVRQAREALAVADQLTAGPAPDPLTALARLDAADDTLDAALGAAQQAVAARRDAAARAERAVLSARMAVGNATTAVAGGRSYASTESRTRLSEAERHLAAAEAALAGDPAAATSEAGQASSLAERAVSIITAARRRTQDLDSSYSGGGGFFGGSGGGWSGGSSYRSSRTRSSSRSSRSSGRSSSSGRRSSGGRSGGRRSSGGRF